MNGSLTNGSLASKSNGEGDDQTIPVDEVRIKLASGIHEVRNANYISLDFQDKRSIMGYSQ